jgi:hypothetical protein
VRRGEHEGTNERTVGRVGVRAHEPRRRQCEQQEEEDRAALRSSPHRSDHAGIQRAAALATSTNRPAACAKKRDRNLQAGELSEGSNVE